MARCGECGLHEELCACAERPTVHVNFGPFIVQHNRERNKPTNTGRMVHLLMGSSTLTRYAVRGETFDCAPLESESYRHVLLFHRPAEEPPDARPELDWAELRQPALDGRPWRLVVLDGTWAQCSRMARRIAPIAAMPMVSLPPGPPTRWMIRDESDPERLCTLEAVLRATALLGHRDEAVEMARWFQTVAARMQFMKGYRPRPVVPAEWSADLEVLAGTRSFSAPTPG